MTMKGWLSLPGSRFSAVLTDQRTITDVTYADPSIEPLGRSLSRLSGRRRKAVLRQLMRKLDGSELFATRSKDHKNFPGYFAGVRTAVPTSFASPLAPIAGSMWLALNIY